MIGMSLALWPAPDTLAPLRVRRSKAWFMIAAAAYATSQRP